MDVAGLPKRIIHASSEICVDHPQNLYMGCLANHATQRRNDADNREANMKSTSILLDRTEPPMRVAVMKARRQIEPFEQLRFDYGDRTAQELFTE